MSVPPTLTTADLDPPRPTATPGPPAVEAAAPTGPTPHPPTATPDPLAVEAPPAPADPVRPRAAAMPDRPPADPVPPPPAGTPDPPPADLVAPPAAASPTEALDPLEDLVPDRLPGHRSAATRPRPPTRDTAADVPSGPPPTGTGSGRLPEAAWWTALAGLPGMGPARLGAIWEAGPPEDAWRLIVEGRAHHLPALAALLGRRPETTAAEMARAAATVDVVETWAAHQRADVTVLVRGDARMPRRLADDVEPPVVLFSAGDVDATQGPTVAVVGTRRCSRSGAELAHEIGYQCARAGARVVSGLAVGIDAAAHAGALAAGPAGAPPVAIVGSGLDVVYPSRSRALWRQVAQRGVVLSEYPLGTAPSRWRFPARNRLVAALAEVVVVVESARTGGSMYTVDEALQRGRDVLAVPGSVRSSASAGTNWLLSQGAQPCCGPDDVLVAVQLAPVPAEAEGEGEGSGAGDARHRPTGDGRRVLRAIGWDPTTVDALAVRTGLGLGALAVALDRLEDDGWIECTGGRIERRAR